MCLTDDPHAAAQYGRIVYEGSLDLDGLIVRNADHLVDRDNLYWPGDSGMGPVLADLGYDTDVIVYQDETTWGRPHRTWRLASARSLQAVRTS